MADCLKSYWGMDDMELHNIFDEELGQIANKNVKRLVTEILQNLETANVYFYKAPASSTKKHHPPCCNVEGGLLRHVKRAVNIGQHLCVAYGLTRRDTDVVISALILHDIWKNDFNRHSSRAANYILNHVSENFESYNDGVFCDMAMDIVTAIRLHMGLWAEPTHKKPIRLYNLMELIVYTADYLSSREDISLPYHDECSLPSDFPGEDLIKGGVL